MLGKLKPTSLVISVVCIIAATVILCVSAISCAGQKLVFDAEYYFVCYRLTDNAVSASSLSDTVASYGGAGYILNYNNRYYVTVSCYYKESDAQSVCDSLKKRELDCMVLYAQTPDYRLKSRFARSNAQLYLGNLNTLNSLSVLAYDCANALDTGKYDQSKAKSVVTSIENGLNGLLKTNSGNCFTEVLINLLAECKDKESGYLHSKDMRYLQIAITDCIISVQLF